MDNIDSVDYVRNNLAVTSKYKEEISYVQKFLVPERTRVQIGTVGSQIYNGKTYIGGGNQVQILNPTDKDKLIRLGDAYEIK